MYGLKRNAIKLLVILSFCIYNVSPYGRIIFPGDEQYIPYGGRKPVGQNLTNKSGPGNGNEKRDLLPRPGVCGPIKPQNNIYGGTEVELEDFTWLANLEYKKENRNILVIACAGNIINHRYILTAGHCVTGDIIRIKGQLISVRVGDHNIDTLNDCNKNQFCLQPPQYFGIEKTIVHENYRYVKGKKSVNDIALLRLDGNIVYSSSVAPICLPSVAPTLPPLEPGMKLVAAGWGHTGDRVYSPEKRMVELPYVANQNCPLAVDVSHLCAGGIFREDTCSGDSGGGIYRSFGKAWFVEGIVSYGRGCGTQQPSVYTRVSSFLDWIERNVLP